MSIEVPVPNLPESVADATLVAVISATVHRYRSRH